MSIFKGFSHQHGKDVGCQYLRVFLLVRKEFMMSVFKGLFFLLFFSFCFVFFFFSSVR